MKVVKAVDKSGDFRTVNRINVNVDNILFIGFKAVDYGEMVVERTRYRLTMQVGEHELYLADSAYCRLEFKSMNEGLKYFNELSKRIEIT